MTSKILKYNVFHFPNDFVKFAKSRSFLMLFLGLLYYGGGAIIVYRTISIKFPWPVLIWLLSAFINILLAVEFPGLFYLDGTGSQDQIISLAILGPINFLRAVCLAVTFVIHVEEIYPYTFRKLWKTRPETWALDDPWIKAIQRSREIGMSTLVGNIRRTLYAIGRQLWKIGSTKVNVRFTMEILLAVILTILLLLIITAVVLKLTGKI